MRTNAWPILLLFLGVLSAAAPGAAQDPAPNVVDAFTVDVVETRTDVPVGGFGSVFFTFTDRSRDGIGTLSPGGAGLQHRTTIKVEPIETAAGWIAYASPASLNTVGGETKTFEVQFSAEPSAREAFYAVNVTVTFTGVSGAQSSTTLQAVGYSAGLEAFSAQVSQSYTLKPKQIVDVPVKISNTALTPRFFDIEVVGNPCDMNVLVSTSNPVQGKSFSEIPVTVQAPAKKFWYPYDSCQVTLAVRPVDNADQLRTAIINVQVAGFFVNPQWVIWFVEALLVLLLIIFLVLRRKARVEEEILGKPQKPWTIPIEALYLKALRNKDERAWYVVRHHLMEEEYRSSLLWYKAYKAATKGSRKKETLVLRQEKSYERWKAKWQKRIALPIKEADRFEAQLQRKLDRQASKLHRKQAGKTDAVRRKMQAAHAKQVEREMAAWEKATRKAQKKGLALPRRPSVPEPDYPDEPKLQPIALADHKWAGKAERFRARKVRQQGDLEVKFEKADARRLRQVRRKVQRIARKLDDPQFIEEHPLLKAEKA